MPLVHRTKIDKSKVLKKATTPVTLTLPTELSEASSSINDYHILIHGEKKIGKTTISVVEEGVLLLTFDPLQKAYEIYQRHCATWNDFMAYLSLLEQAAKSGQFPYKRVVLDGADIWYRRCQAWVCKKLAIDHPSEEKWGKAWDLLKESFSNAVDRIMALPCGVWFICHSAWKEVETRHGGKIEKLLPLIKAGGEEILIGKIDGWFAYDYYGEERVLVVRGDEKTGAGNRISGHFNTPEGKPIKEVPMGNDQREAYSNLLDAFSNKQKFTTLKERDQPAKSQKGGLLKKKSKGSVGLDPQDIPF